MARQRRQDETTPRRGPLVWVALATLVAGCRSDEAPRPAPSTLELKTVAAAPALEIGAFEGGTDASFELVTDVTPLDGDRLLVVDGGAQRLSVFDADGDLVRGWGRRGDGPGEFRSLNRAWVAAPNRIVVLDTWGQRVSVFDSVGTWIEGADAMALSGDSTFRADVWLHGRFWVDGGLEPGDRARIRRVLDRLPSPRDDRGYRYVRAPTSGDLWIRETAAGDDTPSRWTVVGPDAQARFAMELPPRFTPLHIEGHEVWGRWLGAADVNYVRRYALTEADARVSLPGWLAPGTATGAAMEPDSTITAALLSEIRGTLKGMASAQEIHYSRNGSYTTDASALEIELPEGVTFDIVEAHDRGWTLVMGHRDLDRLCGLGYGAAVPPGWMGGFLVCGG